MKAAEQHFPLLLFLMMYKVVLTFASVLKFLSGLVIEHEWRRH